MPRHPRVSALAVLALAGAAVLGLAAPAQAHNFLVSSTPAAGEVVSTLPETFSVTTNGPLLDLSGTAAGFAIQVTDAAGTFYGDGCLTVTGATLATPAALGPAGTYRVVWQVISEDGHTVSDEFTFEWAPTADFVPATGQAAPPVCGAVAPDETPTPTADATATPEPSATAIPRPEHENANLTDVLWIGGAILAVLAAAAVALMIVARRRGTGFGPAGQD